MTLSSLLPNENFFCSDNCASVHPKVMAALASANTGHALPYGNDELTDRLTKEISNLFDTDCQVYCALNGTGANNLAILAACRRWEAVFCTDYAHIACDEAGAAENITGVKLVTAPHHEGKLHIEDIKGYLSNRGSMHISQPRLISITQLTEMGTAYTVPQVKGICDFAHENGMYVHMDGSRISNAAVALGVSPSEFTSKVGLDILSYSCAKNGIMYGDLVVIFNKELGEGFPNLRKQNLQLMSKNRFIAAQYLAMLEGNLWHENASKANEIAKYMESKLISECGCKMHFNRDANQLFVAFPKELDPKICQKYHFYSFPNYGENVYRLVASFDNTRADVDNFIADLKK